MSAPAPTPEKNETREKTGYVVLEKDTSSHSWKERETVTASNATAAIRAYAESSERTPRPGTYIAVPARSWRPLTVEVDTKTVLTIT